MWLYSLTSEISLNMILIVNKWDFPFFGQDIMKEAGEETFGFSVAAGPDTDGICSQISRKKRSMVK